jgi:multiple sugar transport system permease protein
MRNGPTFWARRQAAVTPWLLLAPALILFLTFVVNPLVQTVWTSLHAWDGLGEMAWVGLENYRALMGDERFHVALKNNARWLAVYSLAPVLGLLLAILLHQSVPGIRTIRALFFLPFVISQVVLGLVFAWFYDPSYGLLARLLTALGLAPLPVLADPNLATYGIAVAGLWPQTAYCMILYLAGLGSIDPELIEAARIDGAQGWSMLWHVVLPELRPVTFIVVVVTVVGALRSFDLVATMTGGGPFGSSVVLALLMHEQALLDYRLGYGAAIATVLFLIMETCVAVFLYHLIRRERR